MVVMEVGKGREAGSYLRFVVEHYDNISSRTIFMHALESAWHLEVTVRRLSS